MFNLTHGYSNKEKKIKEKIQDRERGRRNMRSGECRAGVQKFQQMFLKKQMVCS
jgi:hypothetical protein